MENQPDIFGHIVGRAMLDGEFRNQLVQGDEAARIAALEGAGLSTEQATSVLYELDAAINAVDTLASHQAFGGIRPYAA